MRELAGPGLVNLGPNRLTVYDIHWLSETHIRHFR